MQKSTAMKLLYPLTNNPAFSKGDFPEWLEKVRSCLEANGKELVPLSISDEIANTTGLSPFLVSTSLLLFGHYVLVKDQFELSGNDLNHKLHAIINDQAEPGWEMYLRVGVSNTLEN